MIDYKLSLQDQFAAHNTCFGCGPANTKGLRVKTYIQDKIITTANWQPESHHEAFPGMLNGGIIGTLLDCHSNWTAAIRLMEALKQNSPPCTVTACFNVSLKRPTPSKNSVTLFAKIKEIQNDRATVLAELYSDELLCATCEGLFVAVKPDHPAYHRW